MNYILENNVPNKPTPNWVAGNMSKELRVRVTGQKKLLLAH